MTGSDFPLLFTPVIGQWADDLDLDEETAVRMLAPFGGGAFDGEMCGAVSGALAAIGARYGHYEFGDEEGNTRMITKTAEFKKNRQGFSVIQLPRGITPFLSIDKNKRLQTCVWYDILYV